jgi:uncharacterized damage-inducible protein DinB
MVHSAKALMGVFATIDYLIPLVLDDLTDDEARARSRGSEGPSIAWSIGHLLHHRYVAMKMLGAGRDNLYAAAFGEAGATDGAEYPTVERLMSAWKAVAGDYATVWAGVTEEALDAPVEGVHDERTLRDKLAFLAFHEGYHLGATGAMRKAMGHPGPAERIMAMAESR